ncbi:MAG TPA: efflux RND transporter periplasmic adaptor subunit [Gemmataceae bacterium]|nr:efflux RND transporter periplasmic adaptor subunit [Gemmataceae bacterium]
MTDIDAPVNGTDRENVADGKIAPTSGPSARATPAAADPPSPYEAPAAPKDGVPGAPQPQPPVATPPAHRSRKWLLLAGAVAALAVGGYFLVPWVDTALNTVSTDDAYVNGHVTMVAPRVSGQVAKVLVDDNYRVKKGDLLVLLDKEPFQVQVALKRAAVRVAEANLAAAEAKARGLEAQLGSQRWKLQFASEQVDALVAQLKVKAANLRTQQAILDRARADYERGRVMLGTSAMSREDFDQRQQQLRVAEAQVKQAREEVAQVRATLGLAPVPASDKSLTDVPPNLNQNYSAVRAALTDGIQTMAQLGLPLESTNLTPNQVLEKFRRLDADGNIDRILQDLVPRVPAVMQAKAELEQARHDLAQAELNLRYCDIVSEIDGVVTSRNVNPGNDVQAGQQLLAVRSLTEIWIDANFKETQLADLRIGQRVRCEVDMYGSRKEYEGRITGFTMGTGQTLALLPPQNATGNFVKIVQRLPVRVELTDYDPDKAPLFVGLSVTPYVYYKEPPTGPHAGEVLQPRATLPTGPTTN